MPVKDLLAPDSAMAPQHDAPAGSYCMPEAGYPAQQGLQARKFVYAGPQNMPPHKTNESAKYVNSEKVMSQVNRAK